MLAEEEADAEMLNNFILPLAGALLHQVWPSLFCLRQRTIPSPEQASS